MAALLSGLWLGACSVFGIRTVEEPRFTLRERIGAVEIRDYAPRIAAETEVPGDGQAALRAGFQRIAGYIFGKNHARQAIEMTAPVARQGGQDIAMTAPVSRSPVDGASWTVRFFMPASYTMQALPQPDDSAVRLVTLPAASYAVLRFSGFGTEHAIEREQGKLREALATGRWATAGTADAWFYDPPWTLPPLRRNEVAIPVTPR